MLAICSIYIFSQFTFVCSRFSFVCSRFFLCSYKLPDNFSFFLFIPTLFIKHNYTGTIDGNFWNILKIRSALFWIRSISFQLFINHKKMSNVFKIRFLLCHNLCHITARQILWCTNITITWFLFLFRRSQSLFLSLITLCNQSFFLFILFLVARNCCVHGFQLLHMHVSNSRLHFFADVSNCFVDLLFNSFRKNLNVLIAFNCIINLFG